MRVSRPQDWKGVVESLGYKSEREMLIDLYVTQEMSLGLIADLLGFSKMAIKRHVIHEKIALRPRGGDQRSGKSKVSIEKIPDEVIFGGKVMDLAVKFGVHPSTIYHEKKRRVEAGGQDVSGTESHPRGRGYDPIQR